MPAKGKVAFYPLASHEGGLGHVFRCLVLARLVAERGWQPCFVLPEYAPALAAVARRQYACLQMPREAGAELVGDLVRRESIAIWVNDRLASTGDVNEAIHDAGACLACLDDPGMGATGADLLVVALPGVATSAATVRRRLTGLDYLVIDPDILSLRRLRTRGEKLAVTMGGTDDHGLTVAVAEILRRLGRVATLFLGPGFAHDEALLPFARHFEIRRDVPSLAAALAEFDLAITAGGMTPFEANTAGLPCVIVAAEPSERSNAAALCRCGGAVLAGYRHEIDERVLAAPIDVERMSRAAMAALDGRGASRVVDALESICPGR